MRPKASNALSDIRPIVFIPNIGKTPPVATKRKDMQMTLTEFWRNVSALAEEDRMKHFFASIMAMLLFSACTPLGLYYKEGVTVQSAKDTETACKVTAARDVPVRSVTRVVPGRFIPERRICDANGHCDIRGGFHLPPEFITEDANESLRKDAVDLCMRQKGYSFVRLPACEQNIARSTAPGVTTRLPKLTAEACVIRNQGGSWQIVTP